VHVIEVRIYACMHTLGQFMSLGKLVYHLYAANRNFSYRHTLYSSCEQ
jgi:hypothetical protein